MTSDPQASPPETTNMTAKPQDPSDQTADQSAEQAEINRRLNALPPHAVADTIANPAHESCPIPPGSQATAPFVPGYLCVRELGRGTYGQVQRKMEFHLGKVLKHAVDPKLLAALLVPQAKENKAAIQALLREFKNDLLRREENLAHG